MMTTKSQRVSRWRDPCGVAGAVALFLALLVAPEPASAVITLSADFDSGSLCLTPSNACDDNGVASSVSGNTVTLTGRDNFNAGNWKWVYFAASGVSEQQVTFEIGDDFATGSSNLVSHKMVYSYDQENWEFFDNNELQSANDKFVFSNNSAFAQDTVYVAYGLPYPVQRSIDHTASLVSNPWVTSTTASDADFVIGQSPGGTDDIGRTIAPHDLYGYKITDPDGAVAKRKIVLASGVHANETVGNWTLEGLVDFLVSDDLAAAQLRRYAEFYVYPMVNPDGRFAGNNRTTIQVDDIDPNRAWNPPSYTEPDDSSTLDDVRQIGQAMRIDTGQDIDYLIDFHSTVNHSIPYHFGYILPQWQSDPFWQTLGSLEPGVITADASLMDFTMAKFGRDVLNAEFSATFETLFIADENIDRFLNLGRNFGLAWHDRYFVEADLNFDGALNEQDWLLLITGAETDLSEMSPIERYSHGDLDGDGVNSIADFVLFKQLFIEAHSEGAFAAMVQAALVPEASTVAIAMVGGCSLVVGSARTLRRPVLCNPSSMRTEG